MDVPENNPHGVPFPRDFIIEEIVTEEELRTVFDSIDTDKSGDLDLEEVVRALTLLGVPREGADALFQVADQNQDGKINFDEFISFMDQKSSRLRVIFDELDVDCDGLLSAKEVASGIERLYQIKLDSHSVALLLRRVDSNDDGCVSFAEWFRFLMLLPLDDIEEDPTLNAKKAFDYWTETAHLEVGMSLSAFKNLPVETGLSLGQTMIAAGLSGTASCTATAPLERLRMMIQVQGRAFAPTLLAGFNRLIKDSGFSGLWRGNLITAAKNLPESGIFWIAYESMRRLIAGQSEKKMSALTKTENFFCGSVAGTVGFVTLYPFDLVRTRYTILMKTNYGGVNSGLKPIISQIWREHGMRGFYNGLGAGLLSVIPFAGTRLAAYEAIKSRYISMLSARTPEGDQITLKRWAPLAAGALSSACGQLVSFPLYTLSVKMQTESGKRSMIEVAKSLMTTEGIPGLYRGMGVSLLKAVPSSAISFLVYEEAKRRMLSPIDLTHH